MRRFISVTSNNMYLTPELPVHINRISESFQLEQHRHEFIELCYVSEGKGYHYIEGNTIPVAKGDLFYLPIGVSHVFRPSTPISGKGRLIVYNCIIGESFAKEILRIFPTDKSINRLLASKYPEQDWLHAQDREGMFRQSFDIMFEEFRGRKANFLALIQAEVIKLAVLMGRLLIEESGQDGPILTVRRREGDKSLEEIAAIIRREPAAVHHANHYAVEVGMSERHFRRRFKERMGMNFTEYIHKCRIEYSCELLTATTDKVSAVALQTGYKDIKFFHSLFKKLTGISPNKYRSSIRT